ncbi:pleiotropic drug resistance ABC transporter [Cylindrobasidium torrendii FP15055 ss-10]|uniref:Pleiotropic drug resistance ABC transporter n=1 Tax=Cylindrobasidium torrendii FP15055 ss-10 TaxID=1314674 RepID=A0A0D7BME6_9AGAR|nr:pleiotropic drug resistance ABC transporter [Cylindrobasidium torrendii FP15055 ss-10]
MKEGQQVDINHFNPEGDNGLRRSLSRFSQQGADVERAETASMSSTATLDNTVDFRKVLEQVSQQRTEANIKSRELGVAFENLGVVGEGGGATYQASMSSMFNPFAIAKGIQASKGPKTKNILTGFEGVVNPGEMLLVLGRPGSGCTTLLKTLSNQRGEYHSFSGDVWYDSLSPQDVLNNKGSLIHCPEDDLHFATLTVQQTIEFAARLRAPTLRLGYTRDQYVAAVTDLLLTIFGLQGVRHTLVGDASIRGVSGGQKKRVSIVEVLATRACLATWDNSTRGLDASTALEFVQALRIATDIAKMTTIVSLYQAGESLYKHFDKVCVLYEGKMAYYGPANQARDYFINMGYEPANRQTTADFLVAVTDPSGRIPRTVNIPRSADEFAKYFMESDLAITNKKEIAAFKTERVGKPERALAFKESAQAEYAKHTRKASPRITSVPMQTRAVMLRRIQMLRGNMLGTILNIFSFAFQGVITGSVYLKMNTTTNTYFSRGGVLFFAIFFSALIAMSEIPSLYAQRPIVLRQSQWGLYRPYIDQLALTIVDIPVAFASATVFAILIYEMAQLQQSASQFFIFFLFMFTTSLVMKSWFRAVAAAFKDEAGAQTVAGISVLVYSVYTGYSLPIPSMIGALRWLSYLNPLRWSFEGAMVNEFHTVNGQCGSLVPTGPGYENASLENQVCPVVGAQPGNMRVNGDTFVGLSFNYHYSNLWRNYGIVVAYGIAYTIALFAFTEINTRASASAAVVLFKNGSKSDLVAPVPEEDIERGSQKTAGDSEKDAAEYGEAMKETPAQTDVFSWQKLSYVVPTADGPRKLLNEVSGYVAPGKLTALMGESGAGKTTLLNVLAERTDTGVVTGDRFVNGQALPRDFQAQTGYCQQQDTHVPECTVREALLFSARLRQPSSVSDSEKVAYVEQCLKMCGLEQFADAVVGTLSVEAKKRTTIGVELAAKPKLLLFLDEPTSGLDSQSAWAIMLFLRDLATNGQAILCTIHQPSAELFQMFDRLLLLRKGGETVYFGDLGNHSTTLLDYFERNGGRHCEADENPAEYMLETIGAGATASVKENWHSIWKASEEYSSVQRQIDEIHAEGRARPPVKAELHSEYASGWGYQVYQLLMRDFSVHNRDPDYIMAKIFLNIVSGLFLGFSFWRSRNITQAAMQDKLFSLFMALIISAPLSNQIQIPFLKMRSVYEIRERPSRMYNWTALLVSQLLAEIPWNILGSSLFFCCWNFQGFARDTGRAGYTYLNIGILFPIYYTSLAHAIAAMSNGPEIAALLFGLLFGFVVTFNGVVQPFRELGWWKWMYRISPYTYVIEGVLGQALGGTDIRCSPVELVTLTPPSGQTCSDYMNPYISARGGYLTNPNATADCSFCSVEKADDWLLNMFNIVPSHHWRNVGFMVVFIAFNIAATFALTWWFRIRTKSVMDLFRRKSKQ